MNKTDIPKMSNILKEDYIKPLKLTPAELAKYIHVPKQSVIDILNNNKPINADMSIRLGIFLELPMRFFLNMQGDLEIESAQLHHYKEYQQIKPYKKL